MIPGPAIVYVVDDDASVRDSLSSLLRSVGLQVMAFARPADFVDADRPDLPGCLVLDVRLPGQSGLEFQRSLADWNVAMPIVFITGHGDIPMSVSAMKAGAIEFLTKPFRDQDLLDAVHKGIAGDAKRREETAVLADDQARYDRLTPREQEIMAQIVAGQLNKQIAADLAIAEVTVKAHRAQVMRKMKARSLPDLVRIADRLGDLRRKA